MKKVIIGHRGVGKTQFLKRHEIYITESGRVVPHFDLDQEIESQLAMTIAEIFTQKGESYFREQEKVVFTKLMNENKDFVISLGAGFNLSEIPNGIEILFICRSSDVDGRIFLNRPRLNPKLTSLEEFKVRYPQRQTLYAEKASETYFMPEGIESVDPIEKKVINHQFKVTDAYYTLGSHEISKIDALKRMYRKIELRSDLIAEKDIIDLVGANTHFDWLVSVRHETTAYENLKARLDFDQSIKSIPKFFLNNSEMIVSSHLDRIELGIAALKPFENNHQKLSPVVENYEELWIGHHWQQEHPQNRSFLPRSQNGKWLWYRQLCKYAQKINFVRNFTNMSDQPSTYQWLILPEKRPAAFAAVLGQPIKNSRSPQVHKKFFENKNTFFTAIDLNEAEFLEFQPWLCQLGLKFAAVTSPLKKKAYQLSNRRSDLVNQFHSANTLVFDKDQIFSQNTDFDGFKALIDLASLDQCDKIAVWGGGGTLAMMRSVIPKAYFFSSRTATLKDHQMIEDSHFNPDVVIWSAPRLPETQWPVEMWKPKLVIDQNYQENSMGLEYAQRMNCKYISGLEMFKVQAEEQQKFWSPA